MNQQDTKLPFFRFSSCGYVATISAHARQGYRVNTVNTLDRVESGYSRTGRVSTTFRVQWSPGVICTIVPTDPYPRGVKTGELAHISQGQDVVW